MAFSAENIKMGTCKLTLAGEDLGLTIGGVDVEVTTSTHETKADQFGDTVAKERIMGRNITAKVPMAETTLENMVRILPGATMVSDGVKATGTITFSGQPAASDVITVNGVNFTFRSGSAPLATDILIGGTIAATLANAVEKLNNSIADAVSTASYSTNGTTTITVTYDVDGVAGNNFTLAKTGSNITVSGATLTGGVNATKKKVVVPTGVGIDLLATAKKLVLHPIDKPDEDRSEDLIIPLAGTPGGIQFSYKYDQERVYMAEFKGYPMPDGTLFIYGDETATAN